MPSENSYRAPAPNFDILASAFLLGVRQSTSDFELPPSLAWSTERASLSQNSQNTSNATSYLQREETRRESLGHNLMELHYQQRISEAVAREQEAAEFPAQHASRPDRSGTSIFAQGQFFAGQEETSVGPLDFEQEMSFFNERTECPTGIESDDDTQRATELHIQEIREHLLPQYYKFVEDVTPDLWRWSIKLREKAMADYEHILSPASLERMPTPEVFRDIGSSLLSKNSKRVAAAVGILDGFIEEWGCFWKPVASIMQDMSEIPKMGEFCELLQDKGMEGERDAWKDVIFCRTGYNIDTRRSWLRHGFPRLNI